MPDPDPRGVGQPANPNECNSTLPSGTRGETLTPNPNDCNSMLTSGTKWGLHLHLLHGKKGGSEQPNSDEYKSTLTSETSRDTLTPDPNECHIILPQQM